MPTRYKNPQREPLTVKSSWSAGDLQTSAIAFLTVIDSFVSASLPPTWDRAYPAHSNPSVDPSPLILFSCRKCYNPPVQLQECEKSLSVEFSLCSKTDSNQQTFWCKLFRSICFGGRLRSRSSRWTPRDTWRRWWWCVCCILTRTRLHWTTR